jgi:hypothetical protein
LKKIFQAKLKISYHPWPYFLVFVFVFALLSAGIRSLTGRLFLVLFGLVLPLGLAVASLQNPKPTANPLYENEKSFPKGQVPWILWVLTGILALGLRFWGLGGPGWWYEGDEVQNGMMGLELFRHWNWNLFETFGQIPTTLARLCTLFIALTHEPLASLQFATVFLSLLSVAGVYLASRQYFSRPFAVLCTLLCMFGLWPLWTARTGYPAALFLAWEMGVLYALGKWYSAARPSSKLRWSIVLGLVTGLGPYMLTPWPVVVLFVVLLMALKLWRLPRQTGLAFLVFSLGLLTALIPFGVCVLQGRYGAHILAVSVWNHFSILGPLRAGGAYLSALFWKCPLRLNPLPLGGLFNVLMGACFWVGALELWRFRGKTLVRALALGLLVFLSPGILSLGFESIRIFSALPLLLTVTAMGIVALASALPPSRQILFLVLLLSISTGLDAPRLYPSLSGLWNRNAPAPFEKDGNQQAYELLLPSISRQGPGYLFSELSPEAVSPTLAYATYFKNAAWNTDLPAGEVQWAAVLTDRHYQPFLVRRFPGGRWASLQPPAPGIAGRRVLGLLPVNDRNRPLFLAWRDFYGRLQNINWEILDLANGRPRTQVLMDLLNFYPKIPDDPFLQSCFFEKLVFNYTWEKTFYPEDSQANWSNFSEIFHDTFAKCYPDVVLYEKFGRLLAVEGQKEEARGIFEKALKLSPGNPWLKQEMRELGLSG